MPRGCPSPLFGILAHGCLVVLGIASIIWAASVMPAFWHYGVLPRIASDIVAGAPFKSKGLGALLPMADAVADERTCDPDLIRAAAIVHLRWLEQAVADGNQEVIDQRMKSLQSSVTRALSCSPADPFLWLVFYWVKINRDGYSRDDIRYLRLSYLLGPNEGWIALRRDGLALAIFDQLPPDVAQMVIAEFANLVNSGFTVEVAGILAGPGWKVRGRLLPKLRNVNPDYREDLAKMLYHGGLNVTIPGVTLPDPRPWD